MKKVMLLISALMMAVASVLSSCDGSPPETVTTTTTPQFTKITASLTLNDDPGTPVPWGSTIYHWANGITECFGPEGELIFIAKDSEAEQIPVPGGKGPQPATHVYGVPNGARIDQIDETTQAVYFNGSLILTIIDKASDYQY